MVDYTDPLMRDETWRRWKGGDKLATDLRNFYTNKRVWDRLGQSNPMSPTAPAAGRNREHLRTVLDKRLMQLKRPGGGDRYGANANWIRMQLRQMKPSDDTAARRSGATMP